MDKEKCGKWDRGVRQRGGSWEIRFELPRDPLSGTRRRETATVPGTKADARKELRRRLVECDEGVHVDPSRATVNDFIDRWQRDWASNEVSKKTGETYSDLLRKHVKPNIGGVLIQKLRKVHLAELYSKLLKNAEDGGAGLHPRTVGHVHRVLHRVLAIAAEWEVVQTNIAASVRPPRFEETEVEILTPEQTSAVLRALEGQPLFTIVSTALATGMRRGELLALRWQDVDLERAQIRVERSLEQTHGKRNLRIKACKTKRSRRSIALPPYLVAELKQHWKAQQEHRLALGLGKAPAAGLVFPQPDGELWAPDTLSKQFTAFSKKMNLGHTFHALRHTHASQLIASGMDVLTVSRRLGHSSAVVTLRVYAHVYPDSDEKAAKALQAAFSSRTE